MSDENPQVGYKLLLVPDDAIAPPRPGQNPAVAWVLDGIRNPTSIGPFEVIGDVGPDWQLRTSRLRREQVEVIKVKRRSCAVIAGTHREYLEWCRDQGVNPNGGEAFYADLNSLRGRSDVQVVRTGNWESRSDIAQVEDTLRVVNRFG